MTSGKPLDGTFFRSNRQERPETINLANCREYARRQSRGDSPEPAPPQPVSCGASPSDNRAALSALEDGLGRPPVSEAGAHQTLVEGEVPPPPALPSTANCKSCRSRTEITLRCGEGRKGWAGGPVVADHFAMRPTGMPNQPPHFRRTTRSVCLLHLPSEAIWLVSEMMF